MADSQEHRFIWHEAQSQMESARTEKELLQAASTLNNLVREGTKNPVLFYNIGTLLLKAGRHDEASLYLHRAERYSGTTWELDRNISLAAAGGDMSQPITRAWYRYPLFWHFGISLRTRLFVALGAFTIPWILLSLRLLLPGIAFHRPIIIVSCIVLILFGSSVLTTCHQESTARIINIRELYDSQMEKEGTTLNP